MIGHSKCVAVGSARMLPLLQMAKILDKRRARETEPNTVESREKGLSTKSRYHKRGINISKEKKK